MKTILDYLKEQGVNNLYVLESTIYGIEGNVEGYHSFTNIYLSEEVRNKIERIENVEYREYEINVDALNEELHNLIAYSKNNRRLSTDKYLKEMYEENNKYDEELDWSKENIGYFELLYRLSEAI